MMVRNSTTQNMSANLINSILQGHHSQLLNANKNAKQHQRGQQLRTVKLPKKRTHHVWHSFKDESEQSQVIFDFVNRNYHAQGNQMSDQETLQDNKNMIVSSGNQVVDKSSKERGQGRRDGVEEEKKSSRELGGNYQSKYSIESTIQSEAVTKADQLLDSLKKNKVRFQDGPAQEASGGQQRQGDEIVHVVDMQIVVPSHNIPKFESVFEEGHVKNSQTSFVINRNRNNNLTMQTNFDNSRLNYF